MLGSVQLGALNSARATLVRHELSSQELTFFTRDVDYCSKSATVSVSTLLKILKSHEYPNNGSGEMNHSEDNLFQHKLFKLRFLDAASWHPNNVLPTTHQHYSNVICCPSAPNDMPSDKVLFAFIKKFNCNRAIVELEMRNIVLERTKQNSKGKSVKVGAKSLVADLENAFLQMKKKSARTRPKKNAVCSCHLNLRTLVLQNGALQTVLLTLTCNDLSPCASLVRLLPNSNNGGFVLACLFFQHNRFLLLFHDPFF